MFFRNNQMLCGAVTEEVCSWANHLRSFSVTADGIAAAQARQRVSKQALDFAVHRGMALPYTPQTEEHRMR